MFLPSFTFSDTTAIRYQYIQAAEASIMEKLFAQFLTDLIAENQGLQVPLGVADMDIAGGGDGHTFVVRLLVTNAPTGTGWNSTVLTNVKGRFWMGADAEALQEYQEAAIASLKKANSSTINVAVGLAGAAKGTRFMAFMAAQIQ